MKTKQIIVLAVILVALIAGVLIRNSHKPAELATEDYTSLGFSLDPDKVSHIELTQGKAGKPVRIAKKAKPWGLPDIADAPADAEKVNRFLEDVKKTKGELRARDKNLFKDFGVGDSDAFWIRFFDEGGKNFLTLLFGNKKADNQSVFVRRADSDAVYLADANLLGDIGIYGEPAGKELRADFWPDLKIVPAKAEDIQQIKIQRSGEGQSFAAASLVHEVQPATVQQVPAQPKGAQWRFERTDLPFAIDREKVEEFVNSLTAWRAQKVLAPEAGKSYGFEKPFWEMRLVPKQGAEILIQRGVLDQESNTYFIRVSASPIVFTVTSYSLKDRDADDARFFVSNPLGIDPAKISQIKIHAGAKDLTLNPKQNLTGLQQAYLDDLKAIEISGLLFKDELKKKVSPEGKYRIEVQNEKNESTILDVGEERVGEEPKAYPAQKRGNAQPFAISEESFKKLFSDTDRISPKPAVPVPAPAAAIPPTEPPPVTAQAAQTKS